MAIPTTNTAEVLFSSQQPAWERGVELIQGMTSTMFTSRAGLEQRQQKRMRGQWSMRYVTFHDRAAAATRRTRNRAEIAAPVVVPFWPERAILSSLVTNTATISRTATEDWFVIGDYIFLTDGTDSQFRQITAYGISQQALVLLPLVGAVAFGAGTKVYPCRTCVRERGESEFTIASEDATEEAVTYVTL